MKLNNRIELYNNLFFAEFVKIIPQLSPAEIKPNFSRIFKLSKLKILIALSFV